MTVKQWALGSAAVAGILGATIFADPASAVGISAGSSVSGAVRATTPSGEIADTIAAGSRLGLRTGATSSVDTSASTSASASTPVTKLDNAPSALMGATVQSKDGEFVGTVENVQLDSKGKPSKVGVGLSGGGKQSVALAAGDLFYDGEQKVVVSSLTEAQISAMASEPDQSGAKPAKPDVAQP